MHAPRAPTAAGSMTHERSSVTGQKASEPNRPEVTTPTIPPLSNAVQWSRPERCATRLPTTLRSARDPELSRPSFSDHRRRVPSRCPTHSCAGQVGRRRNGVNEKSLAKKGVRRGRVG